MDSLGCPEIDLGEWGEHLVTQLRGRRYPLGATFDLTERCNLACVHCYINQPAGSQVARSRELTTAQVKGILDQMVDAGCLFLCLTGGEPLLRRDFVEIYRYARQRGILVTVFTNGTLVTPQVAEVLAESQPQAVDITLYGATPSTFEAVTQVPGSYARCRRGIELLVSRGLRVTLKSVLLTTNRHELSEMQAFANGLGLKFRYDGLLWPRLDGGEQPYEYRLSVQDLGTLDLEDAERQAAWDKMDDALRGQFVRSTYVYNCGAGIRSFHIDSAGKMSICTMSRRVTYDLLQIPFQEAWERLGDLRKLKRQLDTACPTCTVGALCTQCPGWSQVVHGDDETPVEFVCELGRLRASQTHGVYAGK